MAFGLSFVPGQSQLDRQPGGGGGGAQPRSSPVQQAIQMLSLRLPHVVGAQALAPGPLLQGPGAAGVPSAGGGGIEALLRLLFGVGPQGGGPISPTGAPITPGPSGRYEVPPMRVPQPRVTAGLLPTGQSWPRPPGTGPAYGPLPPTAGGPSLPSPSYTPVPSRPMGWGNAPDNWRPFSSAPVGQAVPRSTPTAPYNPAEDPMLYDVNEGRGFGF